MKTNAMSRVLIIEDNSLIAFSLQHMLEEMGHSVVGWAPTKPKALALARNTRPDCIVSDLNLERPGDGAAAVEAILAEHPVPVVFVTGVPEAVPRTGVLSRALVLAKPVGKQELQQVMSQLITLHQKQDLAKSSYQNPLRVLKSPGQSPLAEGFVRHSNAAD